MAEVFTNLAKSTLAAPITAGALSLTVATGDGNDLFPAPTGGDFFRALLYKKATGDIEIINCTARSADVLTITRTAEEIGNITPAVAYAFDAGDIIELRPTAAFFNALAAGASSVNIQQGIFTYGVDTGVANAYVVAMNPTATALANGQEVRVLIANANTGASTLKVDGLPAVNIKTKDGNDPQANDLLAGRTYTLTYDGTNFVSDYRGIILFGGVSSTGLRRLHTPGINDVNVNEILDFNATASAVNHIEVFNDVAGFYPGISAKGESNRGLTFNDSNSNKELVIIPQASAVNYHELVNSATNNDLELRANGSDANINLALNGKGTGFIKTNEKRVYGFEYLNTPVELVNNTTTGSAVQMDLSAVYAAAHTAGAKVLICNCYGRATGISGNNSILYIRNSSTGLINQAYAKLLSYDAFRAESQADIHIKLDANGDFWWSHSVSPGSSGRCIIYLVAYGV